MTPLLIRFGRIGDMVLQEPLLHLLHRRFRRPCHLLTSGEWSTQIYFGHADVETVRQLRARHAPFLLSPERWSLVYKLSRHNGPVYVSEDIPRQVDKIRRLLFLARIPLERCLFINDCVSASVHWVDRLLDFGRLTPRAYDAENFLWVQDDLQRAPRLTVFSVDRADRHVWLQERGFLGRPLILVQPGNRKTSKGKWSSPGDNKLWSPVLWGGLLRAMSERLPSAQILLCGSSPEAGLLNELRIASGMTNVAIAASDLPLRRLLALAEIAHSMVTVDTGPAHLAAAVGCPLVVLYGDESPERWDRRNAMGRPVINLGGTTQGNRVDTIDLDSVVRAWLSIASAQSTNS